MPSSQRDIPASISAVQGRRSTTRGARTPPASGIGIDYPHAPRARDVVLRDGRRLYEVLRDGRFVLLAPDAARSVIDERVVLAPPADETVPWTLVRPDGHVAWRGGRATLRAALARAGLSG